MRTLILLLFFLLTTGSVSFAHYAAYSRYTHKSDLNYFDSIIQSGDSSALAFRGRGVAAFNLQQYGQASQDLKIAFQKDSTDWEALELNGACLYYLKNQKEGLALMEEAEKMDSTLSYLFLLKGNELFEKMHFAEAEVFYSQAIARTPDFFTALYNRAMCYKELKRFEDAMNDVKHGLEIDPNNLDIVIVKNEIELNIEYRKYTAILYFVLAFIVIALGVGITFILRKRKTDEYFGND